MYEWKEDRLCGEKKFILWYQSIDKIFFINHIKFIIY